MRTKRSRPPINPSIWSCCVGPRAALEDRPQTCWRSWCGCDGDFYRQPATNPLAPRRQQCDAAKKAVEPRFACSCTKSLTTNPCRIKGRGPKARDKVRIDYVFHVKPLDA